MRRWEPVEGFNPEPVFPKKAIRGFCDSVKFGTKIVTKVPIIVPQSFFLFESEEKIFSLLGIYRLGIHLKIGINYAVVWDGASLKVYLPIPVKLSTDSA